MRIWNLAFSQSALNQNRHLTSYFFEVQDFEAIYSEWIFRYHYWNFSKGRCSRWECPCSTFCKNADKKIFSVPKNEVGKTKHLEGRKLGFSHRTNQSLPNLAVSWVLCGLFLQERKKNAVVIWNYIHNVRNPFFFFYFWLLGYIWKYSFCHVKKSHWPVEVHNPYDAPLFLHLFYSLSKVWKSTALVLLH